MNEEHLQRYARLLVERGVSLRRDQPLFIRGERIHRELALRVAEVGYEVGGGPVHLRLLDPLEQAQLIRLGRMEDIALFHEREHCWCNEILRTRGALVILSGEERPDLASELARSHPERHAAFHRAKGEAGGFFETHGIGRRLCPWVIAAGPTPAWARALFPEESEAEALDRLAAHLFAFTYADHPDGLERAEARARRLRARCRRLEALAITELRITGGGNDLTLGLAPGIRWLGGVLQTLSGQSYLPNLPSEEVFTTPDRRLTEGRLVATRPLRTRSGVRVSGLALSFRRGRVVDFSAAQGREAFARWLDADPGARYLGEVGLVGQDSPIARSGRTFGHPLLDENAAAHVALGKGFAMAFENGESLGAGTLAEMGCNDAQVHTDVMLGSDRLRVVASRSREGEVVLIDEGHWTRRFAGE